MSSVPDCLDKVYFRIIAWSRSVGTGVLITNTNEIMLVIKSEYDFEIVGEPKESSKKDKFLKLKKIFNTNCDLVSSVKEKRVYFKTISADSIRRSVKRICNSFRIKSKNSGYEKFLTDEEKRLHCVCDNGIIEGFLF